MMFGIPGMIISALLFAGGLFAICYFLELYSFSLIECLLFGTLVSALDPVATLSIFRAMGLDSNLQCIVLGESVFNDAVAITMFKILQRQNSLYLPAVSFEFVYVLLGSAFVGILFGMISTFIFKFFRFREESTIELSLFILISYLPFLLCETFGLSGILGLLFVGMTGSIYTVKWMSEKARNAVKEGFSIFSYLGECFCFMYLGIGISTQFSEVIVPLVITCIVLMLLSRGLVVFLFASLNNRFRDNKILFSHQCIIWVSGMRGVVAYSLALSFPYGNPDAVISTTQVIILFTLLCVSFGIYPILKGLRFIDELAPMIRVSVSSQGIPEVSNKEMNWFESFQANYLKKYLSPEKLIDENSSGS
jgi:NhaP-type Na+/H+ or K+/H+ antiporter